MNQTAHISRVDITSTLWPVRLFAFSNALTLFVGPHIFIVAILIARDGARQGNYLVAISGALAIIAMWLGIIFAWNNLDRLHGESNRLALATYLLLMFSSLFVAAMLNFNVNSLAFIVAAVSAVLSVIGAIYQNFATLKYFGKSLPQTIEDSRSESEHAPKDVEHARPIAGFIFIMLACLLVLSVYWFGWVDSGTRTGFVLSYVALLMAARLCFAPDLDRLRAVDGRAHIVFLRPFATDKKVVLGFKDLVSYSLESRLAGYFNSLGPFIAVAAPNNADTLARGAARASFEHNEWQASVESWIEAASNVVLVLGTSPGLKWELTTAISLCRPGRLIIVFPELSFADLRRFYPRKLHEVLKEAAVGTAWQRSIENLRDVNEIRSLVLHDNGAITCFVSTSSSRTSHLMGAILAHATSQSRSSK